MLPSPNLEGQELMLVETIAVGMRSFRDRMTFFLFDSAIN
jgi:hypothetical protein